MLHDPRQGRPLLSFIGLRKLIGEGCHEGFGAIQPYAGIPASAVEGAEGIVGRRQKAGGIGGLSRLDGGHSGA
ncbi:hypothetical protein FV220_22045 [Methylobacterium sp. WL19]|nr:hypothetical protein FV220_22045 [Methylobacterium sp. WL19]